MMYLRTTNKRVKQGEIKMKHILAGLILINAALFTTSASANAGCLPGYQKVTTGQVSADGNEIYTCITTYRKQINSICAPLFDFQGDINNGFGCVLKRNRMNSMCKDINGRNKQGYRMAFNLPRIELNRFPEASKDRYKSYVGRNNTVITYKCDTAPR